MILLANTLIWIASILNGLVTIVIILVLIAVVLSWVNADPSNPIVRFLHDITEPMLEPLRRRIPPIGGRLDISPIILLMVLSFIKIVIVDGLMYYAASMRRELYIEIGSALQISHLVV